MAETTDTAAAAPKLSDRDKEMHYSGQLTGMGEMALLAGFLLMLEGTGWVEMPEETPSWGIALTVALGLYCVWRGRKHH
jgi:hypothetical protein